jgi:hypothetical protein
MATVIKTQKSIRLSVPSSPVELVFNLHELKMSREQRQTLEKLFAQNPEGVVSEETHTRAEERGKDGPARKYLTKEEFASIRELGVRLGTSGVAAAIACDFCLHCVKMDPLAELGSISE